MFDNIMLRKNPDIGFLFLGNPGNGQIQVSYLLTEYLFHRGILEENKITTVEKQHLVSGVLGKLTKDKTNEVMKEALGGLLHIYVASDLTINGKDDSGIEAIDSINEVLAQTKKSIAIVLTGFRKDITEMLDIVPEFKEHFKYEIFFLGRTHEELKEAAKMIIEEYSCKCTDLVFGEIINRVEQQREINNFGNYRELRLFINRVYMKHCLRVNNNPSADKYEITMEDVKG